MKDERIIEEMTNLRAVGNGKMTNAEKIEILNKGMAGWLYLHHFVDDSDSVWRCKYCGMDCLNQLKPKEDCDHTDGCHVSRTKAWIRELEIY